MEQSKIIDTLETYQTERSSMSHIVDMISMEMFTSETTSSHMMIGLGLLNLDHVTLEQPEGC